MLQIHLKDSERVIGVGRIKYQIQAVKSFEARQNHEPSGNQNDTANFI